MSNIKPSEFLKKLDLSKLDANTATLIRSDLLAYDNVDLLEGSPEFEEVKKLIEENYPQALGIIPIPKADIKKPEPKKIIKPEPIVEVKKLKPMPIKKSSNKEEKQKHQEEIQSMSELIELIEDTVKENPKDTETKEYLELLQDTLADMKTKKFEDGGGVGSQIYATGGLIGNKSYLEGLSESKRERILKNIATHYGISIEEAQKEVTDNEAESLYEYVTDNSLRMEVYNDLENTRKFSIGGGVDDTDEDYNEKKNIRLYNFIKDDFINLEKAIEENNKEEIDKFFGSYSYWNIYLKSLEPKKGSNIMYHLLKDDLVKLEKAIAENNKEEIERFFSYWNTHFKSLKHATGGWVDDTDEDYNEKKNITNKFVYKFHEERGEISAYVEDMTNGNTVWEFKYPDHDLPEEEREMQSSPVDDGFMRHFEDISGLEKYLKQLGDIPEDAEIVSEVEANNNYGYFKRGGGVKSLKPIEFDLPEEYKYTGDVANNLRKNGIDATAKYFDQYQGAYIHCGKDKLWVTDSFVSGKRADKPRKYRSASLNSFEGQFSATRGDYFQLEEDYVFEDSTLVLIKQNGEKVTIKNPTVSQLPDLLEVGNMISYTGGTSVFHWIFTPEGDEGVILDVTITEGGDVDASDLIEYCNRNMAKGGGVGDNDEEFIVHGTYTVSNSGGYEIMISNSGDAARVRDAFGSDNTKTSDWLEIEYITDEEGEHDEEDNLPSEPIIDPQGYNIPLNMVMRVNRFNKGGGVGSGNKINCEINAMRNIVYFIYNFPYNFIESVWGDSNMVKAHLNSKFDGFARSKKIKKSSAVALLYFITDLDAGNQKKLFTWVANNYQSFSTPLGGSFGDNDMPCKINAMRNMIYFMFNYPQGFVEKAFDNDKHLSDTFSRIYNNSGSSEAVLKFSTDLSVGNQTKLFTWIAENYKSSSTPLMADGGDLKNKDRVEIVLKHYIIAALWSSTDDEDQSFDSNYSYDEFDKDNLEKIRQRIIKFMIDNDADLKASGLNDEQIGHDLWLTQVGHGAGFWDREGIDKELGDRLSSASKQLGESAYVFAQDGKVYIDGGDYAKGGGIGSIFSSDTDTWFDGLAELSEKIKGENDIEKLLAITNKQATKLNLEKLKVELKKSKSINAELNKKIVFLS